MGLPFTSLHIGARVVSCCDDGLLGPEYALFDADDIVPGERGEPVSREQGYLTSAAEARRRLSSMGITADLAVYAAAAMTAEVRAAFARAPVARHVAMVLGGYELFEGAMFSATTQTYQGTWLDMGALARATPLRGAAVAMQALHLAVALDEVKGDTPVFLSTGTATRGHPQERTFVRVAIPDATALPSALLALRPPAEERVREPGAERSLRAMLLRRLDEREGSVRVARQRLSALRSGLASGSPSEGPREVPTEPQAQPNGVSVLPTPRPHAATTSRPTRTGPPPLPAWATAVRASAAPPPISTAPPPVVYGSELVESLSLPPAAREGMLPEGARPSNPLEARIACVRMARALARDYRLSHGVTLHADARAVEIMQRHLRGRFPEGAMAGRSAGELQRHGALLGEIVARTLSGEWVDVSPSDMGAWVMHVRPRTRTRPIERVYRFVTLGHREEDLVSYYLDLEAQARSGA